ncbi:hypothetical protein O9G_000141 [Rozella allomycis CSF55]|uniref:Uncharacterized protein n=1 Tax=Rozella allomycis (strain CSF55) TaxID=988480 RepID=A0A075ANX0_ROZAC|nr:hypothetical protein O9G_000141 [Rozella allomycis CSF55]|eukprot:EPZ31662.1 hypothetical protein O9G_000141 [Rozella allomycis CSF55]
MVHHLHTTLHLVHQILIQIVSRVKTQKFKFAVLYLKIDDYLAKAKLFEAYGFNGRNIFVLVLNSSEDLDSFERVEEFTNINILKVYITSNIVLHRGMAHLSKIMKDNTSIKTLLSNGSNR